MRVEYSLDVIQDINVKNILQSLILAVDAPFPHMYSASFS